MLDLIAERETAATTAAEELREQIAKPSAELALAETKPGLFTITATTSA